jgi:hypothetical protein
VSARIAVLALAICACSTTHAPRPSARVGVVIRHGGAYYVKEGQLSPVGPFAGGLEDLVGAQPQARRLAHRATTELEIGVPLYVVGLAGVVASLAAIHGDARWPLAGASAVAAGTGLTLIGAGFTNAVDAVNVHNDDVP